MDLYGKIYSFSKKALMAVFVTFLAAIQALAFELDYTKTLNFFGSYNGDQFHFAADIATDSQGLPVVVYINTHTLPDSLMMTRCLDSSCDTIATTILADDLGNKQFGAFVSIAFKDDDTLGIMFSREEGENSNIYYIECEDATCTQKQESLVEDRSVYQLKLTDIAFDNDGKLNVLAGFDISPGYLILYRCDLESGVFTNRIVNNETECAYPWIETNTYPTNYKIAFNSNHLPVISWQHKPYFGADVHEEVFTAQCQDSDCINQTVSSDLINIGTTHAIAYDFDISADDVVASAQIVSGNPSQAAFSYCVDAACATPNTNQVVAPAETGYQALSRINYLPSGNVVVSYTVRRFDSQEEDSRNNYLYATTCYPTGTSFSCEDPTLIEPNLGYLRHAGSFHTASNDDGTIYLTYFDTLPSGTRELKIARLGLNTCTLAPSDDSYIRNHSRADNNYGDQSRLHVRPSNQLGRNIRRSLVRFDIAEGECIETGQPLPASGVIKDANLQLTQHTAPAAQRQLHAYRIQQDWFENLVTWNNQPNKEMIPTAATDTSSAGAVMSWDVTSDVEQFFGGSLSNYGWMLEDSDESTGIDGSGVITRFSSKEGSVSEQPVLIIRYSD